MAAVAAAGEKTCVGPIVFVGTLVCTGDVFPDVTTRRSALAVRQDGVIALCVPCENGDGDDEAAIAACKAKLGCAASVHFLSETQLLLPGFIDVHIHAPQYAYVGLGTDRPLMGQDGWLETHAFPSERRLSGDLARARAVFQSCIRRTLAHGTTTALYFATQSAEVSGVLASCCADAGQRAFVGRVAMDRNCPGDYSDKSAVVGGTASATSLSEISAAHGPLVSGAITPRFVPTCSSELLHELGALAKKNPGAVVQSHISESLDEVAFTCAAEGDTAARDAAILDRYGLLRAPSVMAHAVHLRPEEMDLLAKRGCALAHCPLSNAFFAGGHLDVLTAHKHGCKVALGTDVAGGYSPSMLSAMRHAVASSRDLHASSAEDSLSWRGSLWLATAAGADALGLSSTCGRLREGCAFDAIIVDAEPAGVVSPYEARDFSSSGADEEGARILQPAALLERFLNLGDDRNIIAVYVAGRKILNVGSIDAHAKKRPRLS